MSFITPVQQTKSFTLNDLEVLEEIQARIELESNGLLDDFNPASPLSAITEGQAYATSLLADELNDLPDEFLLNFFSVLGVNRALPRNATVPIEFTRTTGFTRDVTIPRGFVVFTAAGLTYTLNNQVILSSNLVSAIGYATAVNPGEIYNVPLNTITGFSLAIPGLASVTNPGAARGGSDQETINRTIQRGLSFLQFRHLVSARDFETATRAILGENYSVKAYTYYEIVDYLYSGQFVTRERGDVFQDFVDGEDINTLEREIPDDIGLRFVYLVTSDNQGDPINEALENRVRNFVLARVQAGTELFFIRPEVSYLKLDITALENPAENVINRSVSTIRLNQSVLYQSIGRNISMRSLYNLVERFFQVETLSATFIDQTGEGLLTITDRTRNILAPSPATVFIVADITVTTSTDLTYEYNLFSIISNSAA